MGNRDFLKGMEAGAKPFEEKFEKLSEDTKKISGKVNEKLDDLGAVMDVVIDDMSDIRKKELYHLNTPYDLQEDLDDDEKEILAALLLRLSEFTDNNEHQKKFIRSVNFYIGVKAPQRGFDISCIENIENISVQKMMLQVIMEYLYLGTENFSFLEDLEEEVFEYFSVNRKGIREIEEYIKTVYQAAGKEGIAEKYGFVPEEQMEEPDRIETPEMKDVENAGKCLEISQVCSDRVNLRKSAELNEYLVYLDEENNVLYKVHKQTGERTKVKKSDKSKDLKTFCGAGNRVCIIYGNKIEIINVDTNEENEIEVIYERQSTLLDLNNFGGTNAGSLQCNGKYLVYNTTVNTSNAVVYVDLENLNSTLVVDDKKVSIHSEHVFLDGNMLYMIVDKEADAAFEKKRILYRYDLTTEKIEQLFQVDVSTFIDFKADIILCGRDLFRYKEYIIGYSLEGYEIDIWYLNLHNIKDKKIWKVSLEDHDECFLEDEAMRFEKYMILFTEEGAIWKYDILKEEFTMVVEESECVDSYTKGVFKSTTTYSLNIYQDDINLLNDTLYYKPDNDEIVYRVPINECSERPEAL